MITYEDECVDCGLPCMGRTCPLRNVPHYYCDSCKDEHETVYEFDGEELCIECIEKRLTKVI
jgi:hypothetical protein